MLRYHHLFLGLVLASFVNLIVLAADKAPKPDIQVCKSGNVKNWKPGIICPDHPGKYIFAVGSEDGWVWHNHQDEPQHKYGVYNRYLR